MVTYAVLLSYMRLCANTMVVLLSGGRAHLAWSTHMLIVTSAVFVLIASLLCRPFLNYISLSASIGGGHTQLGSELHFPPVPVPQLHVQQRRACHERPHRGGGEARVSSQRRRSFIRSSCGSGGGRDSDRGRGRAGPHPRRAVGEVRSQGFPVGVQAPRVVCPREAPEVHQRPRMQHRRLAYRLPRHDGWSNGDFADCMGLPCRIAG